MFPSDLCIFIVQQYVLGDIFNIAFNCRVGLFEL